MARKRRKTAKQSRRRYSDEFKEEAVRMLLDGQSAISIAENLGLSGTGLLYRWKNDSVQKGGQAASVLETRVYELEEQLRIVERERDILKKALSIFSQKG